MEHTALFRPAKRRKFIRQHDARFADEMDGPRVDSQATSVSFERDATPEDLTVSSILKLRRQQRSRTGGVQFSNSRSVATEDLAGSTALMAAEDPADSLRGVADRFVGHSGQVVDVDKHMVAYIDSELAKRRVAHASSTEQAQPDTHERHATSDGRPSTSIPSSTREPTSQGLLHEVDVLDKAPQSLEPPPPKPRKPRLDRFGRPLPQRKPRKGRPNEDIVRDKLVEDIMNESGGLDVYQKHDSASAAFSGDVAGGASRNRDGGNDNEGDADSRLASQFQQDYLDALASRQQAQQQKKAIPGADPGQKGPKLGGSRQQRAAMREREAKEEKEKGKGK